MRVQHVHRARPQRRSHSSPSPNVTPWPTRMTERKDLYLVATLTDGARQAGNDNTPLRIGRSRMHTRDKENSHARASARRDRTLALRLRAEPQPRLQYIKGKQLPPAREVTAPGPPEEGAHRAGVEQIGATRGLAEQVLLRVCVQ